MPSVLVAQDAQRYRVIQRENFRRDPSGSATILASVAAGTELNAVGADGRWIEVELEGWIWSRSVGTVSSSDFDLRVTAGSGENLRARPNGDILARLSTGTLLDNLGRDGNWYRVRRVAWMWGESLEPIELALTPAGSSEPAGETDPPLAEELPEPGELDRGILEGPTELTGAPDGEVAGSLSDSLPVKILERADGWVRVQIEGWVPSERVRPAGEVLWGVSAAELRADPEAFRGKVLRWDIQFISLQTADQLRQDLRPGEQYILARGPYPERGFVYVSVGSDHANRLRDLQPLARVEIVARVRTGKSRFMESPVLELIEMSLIEP